MRLDEITVSAESLAQAGWEALLAGDPECEKATSALGAAAREAGERGETEKQHALSFLHAACSMYLKLDAPDPLRPMFEGPEWRSAAVEDFTAPQLTLLREMAPGIAHNGLRARIGDLLWHRRRDHEMARLAIDAYLALAQELVASGALLGVAEWPERAMQLAAQIKDGDRKQACVRVVEELLERDDPAKSVHFAARLMELLLERGEGDPSRYIPFAEERARRAAAGESPNLHAARSYWKIAGDWHRLAGDNGRARSCAVEAAETFVVEAERRLLEESGGPLVAIEHLTMAIAALRRIPGTKARVAEVQARLAEIQPRAEEGLKRLSFTVDIGAAVEAAKASVSGKPMQEALIAVARAARIRSRASVLAEAREQIEKFPLSRVFGGIHLGEGGTIRSRTGGLNPSDPESVQQTIEEQALQLRPHQWSVTVRAQIEPARQQFAGEHSIRTHELLEITSVCPFVPPGREWTFARGLHAGLQGDFMVAASLLVPQIENSLRWILMGRGVITTKLDPDRIQEDYGLGALLVTNAELKAALEETLGVDLVYELRGLLVEKLAGNLRNEIAHGMLDDGGLQSHLCAYTWWLALWLCVSPGLWSVLPSAPESE